MKQSLIGIFLFAGLTYGGTAPLQVITNGTSSNFPVWRVGSQIVTGAVDLTESPGTGPETDPIWSAVSNQYSKTDAKWDGGTNGLNAATGRASLGLSPNATNTATWQPANTNLTDLADGTLSKSKVQDSANWDAAYTHSTGVVYYAFDRYIEGRYWNTQAVCIGTAPSWTGITLTRVLATTLGASTPTIAYNLQERPWGTYGSSGSNVYSAVAIADSNGDEKTSFNDSTLGPKAGLFLTTPTGSETGNVLGLVIRVEWAEN